MSAFLLAVSLALLISALCSLAEATLLSLTPSQVAEMSAREPRKGAIWRRFKQNIEKPIAVILLINTSAHTMGASIAGAEFDALYGQEWLAVFSLVFTLVMLQFTEILPKTLGVRYNRELARVIGAPLALLIRVLNPFLQLVYWVNRPFEGRRRGAAEATPLEEITALASAARLANQIGRHQEQIIRGASRLSEIQVREMESVLQVGSGQTVILGGLMQDDVRRARDQIPGADRLDVAGELLRFRDESAVKTELVIFLRPTVVANPSLESDELKFFQRFLPNPDAPPQAPVPERTGSAR